MKQIDFDHGTVTGNILGAALPMLVAQILSLLYNIVDRIYIARIPSVGTTALGAVGLCFPIIVIITAFSNLFGSGGAPLFSINRGKGNIKKAEAIMNTSFSMLCICGVALMVIGMLMIPKTCAYVWTVLIGYKTMKKGSTVSKRTKRYSWIIGLLIFITALLLGCIIVNNIAKEKKTAAAYTAQSTVKRINAQLDQYVELSEF